MYFNIRKLFPVFPFALLAGSYYFDISLLLCCSIAMPTVFIYLSSISVGSDYFPVFLLLFCAFRDSYISSLFCFSFALLSNFLFPWSLVFHMYKVMLFSGPTWYSGQTLLFRDLYICFFFIIVLFLCHAYCFSLMFFFFHINRLFPFFFPFFPLLRRLYYFVVHIFFISLFCFFFPMSLIFPSCISRLSDYFLLFLSLLFLCADFTVSWFIYFFSLFCLSFVMSAKFLFSWSLFFPYLQSYAQPQSPFFAGFASTLHRPILLSYMCLFSFFYLTCTSSHLSFINPNYKHYLYILTCRSSLSCLPLAYYDSLHHVSKHASRYYFSYPYQ